MAQARKAVSQLMDREFAYNARAAWSTVALLALIAVVSWLDRLILSMLVTPIAHDLGVTDVQFSLLLGMGFVGVFVLAGLPIATLLDRGNRKWILASAVLFWCLSTVAAGFAQSFATLLIARCGVAIGEATLMPAAVSMISDLFPQNRRRIATSVFMAANILAATGAYLIGGIMIEAFDHIGAWNGLPSWRLVLITVSLLGVPREHALCLRGTRAVAPGRASRRRQLHRDSGSYHGTCTTVFRHLRRRRTVGDGGAGKCCMAANAAGTGL